MKHMTKKKAVIIGVIALALIAVIGAALAWSSHLKAAVSVAQSAAMNERTVAAKNTENAQIAQEMQEQYQIPDITLTPEMRAAIADGSMTLEQAAAQLLSGDTGQTDALSVEEATPETSATEDPVTQETPVTQEPATTETPVTQDPVTQETPVTQEPAKQETPVTQEPAKQETPVAQEPAKQETPVAQEPVKQETPVAQEPVKQETPVTQEPVKEEPPQPSPEEKAKAEKEARIQNLFAQLYVLRDTFNSRIEGVVQESMNEFLSLEPEKQTNTAKIRIVYAHMDDVESMEAECDAQVNEIIAQLQELDPATAEKASQYYQNQKELKKAELVARYTGKAN